MRRYRFALRPRWLLSHVLVLLAVVVMVNLGFWQLRRLHDRRAANELITNRSTAAPVPVQQEADPTTSGDALDRLRYRRVTAEGSYDAAGTTVIASRTQGGAPGGWVVTPMSIGSSSVLVLRGFERLEADGTLPTPPPPSGTVRVVGYAMVISRFDPIANRDLDSLRKRSPGTLPVLVQLATSTPNEAAGLAPVALPDLGEGPHLAYAVQWFIFSTIAGGGYLLVLRREAASQAAEAGGEGVAARAA